MAVSRAMAEQMERSSWIRRMFEIGIQLRQERGAANVFDYSIGNPDVEPPEAVIEALRRVVAENRPRSHAYMPNAGFAEVREKIAARLKGRSGVPYTAADILMTTGAAGAINTVLKAILDPGDEVLVLCPYFPEYRFYVENHGGRMVRVETGEDFQPDVARIAEAITPRTKAIILNTPNNPTGKVFSREELVYIAGLCEEFDALAITDEIYEHILYDGAVHIPIMSLPGMRERSILVNSMSKTYSVTGWRVGWVLAPPDLTDSIRKVHDFLTVGAAAPLQRAGAMALALGDEYYTELASEYQKRRDHILITLQTAGLHCFVPRGAYYVMTDISGLGFPNDVAFVRYLIETMGVAAVPGSSFYSPNGGGNQQVRFCFCKKYETLDAARKHIVRLNERIVG
jgi:aminotransferase